MNTETATAVIVVLAIVCLFSLLLNWKQYKARKSQEKKFYDIIFEFLRWGIDDNSHRYAMLKGLLSPEVHVTHDNGSKKIRVTYGDSSKPLAIVSLDLRRKDQEVLVNYYLFGKFASKTWHLGSTWRPRNLVYEEIGHYFRPDPVRSRD